jgi:hypothetical protein
MDGDVARISVHLRVRNDNDFDIEDRFDGVPYTFAAGKAVTLEPEAAAHILGWQPGVEPKAMFNHVCKRWGWNTPSYMQSGDNKKFFEKLTFTPVTFKTIEVVENQEVDEMPSPLPPRKGARADASA